MFGFGMPELILILLICLVVLGPGRLPQLGSAFGAAIKGFRGAVPPSPLDPRGEEKPSE